jgi:hypothetical protein
MCCALQLAQFDFADATFGTEYDYFSATTKLCKAGFEGQVRVSCLLLLMHVAGLFRSVEQLMAGLQEIYQL